MHLGQVQSAGRALVLTEMVVGMDINWVIGGVLGCNTGP